VAEPVVGPLLGAWADPEGTRFRVWAPDAHRVEVVLGGEHALLATHDGYWEGHLAGVGPGATYQYRLDGGSTFPDPASMAQPEGVHGPSAVVEPSFAWTDEGFVPSNLEDSVFYELHVGTFTPDGTFDAAIRHLPRLADLGVTTVELMPLSQFPGGRNWGYDGVLPFAVQDTYGGLDGLRRFVDAAHGHGLAVCVDVVHNHIGPEGNVLARFGPYFTDRHRTPWGDALNFDGPGSDEVRRYFIESARFLVAHAHVDAFRLDAVHAIIDSTAHPYVEQLTFELHRLGQHLDRPVLVIAESATNDPRLTRPVKQGGWGLDGQWNDDFHHALHVVLTGEHDGYYEDYDGVADLVSAFQQGFVLEGRWSASRQMTHGHPRLRVDPRRLVVFSANHDQVGNRLAGDRLTAQVDAERAKVAAALALFSSSVPMIFMGDEHADPAPFPYFVSHTDPELVEAVRKGRAEELAAFSRGRTPPDPQAEATFRSAVLDHSLADEGGAGRSRWLLHQELLRLRRELQPGRADERGAGTLGEPDQLAVAWGHGDEPGRTAVLLVCFDDRSTSDRATISIPVFDEPQRWRPAIDTADPRWGGPGAATPGDEHSRHWQLAGPSALLLVADPAS
jgi:maltooligosyltrehalose trehalohydrolase